MSRRSFRECGAHHAIAARPAPLQCPEPPSDIPQGLPTAPQAPLCPLPSAVPLPMPHSPPSDVRVGLIGYGYAGQTFHAPLVASVPGLRLAAFASRDAAKVARDWPGLPVEADPLRLCARDDVDLVVIASPNDSHHPLALAALRAGKHVVVDKPFTVTLAQAQELDAAARERRCLLSVFHNRRWDGDFLTLRALLARGELGRLVELESRFDRFRPVVRQRWREQSPAGGGLWFDLGPHLLDQALQLFGWPQALRLDLVRQRDHAVNDDGFECRLLYAGGLRATLRASALTALPGPRFLAHGTRGSVVKWGLDAQEDALKAGRRPLPGTDWGVDPQAATLSTLGADGETLQPVALPLLRGDYPAYYAAVRDAIVAGAPNPVPAAQAIEVMALIELGVRSDAQRRELPAVAAVAARAAAGPDNP